MVDFATLGTVAIAADAPAGKSARYEPEFEQLETEISKLEAISGGEVDWKSVIELATTIIGQKSKDMLVASYLVFGLFKTRRYEGLADGLEMYQGMLVTHWEQLFPAASRAAARKTALKWLADRLQPLVDGDMVAAADEAMLRKCHDKFDEIYKFTTEKFDGDPPALNILIKSLKTKTEHAKAEGAGGGDGAGEGASADGAGNGATAAPTGSGGGAVKAVAVPMGALGNRKDALKRLKEIADFFRKNEPHNPAIFLIERAVKWAEMPLETVLTEILHRQNFQEARNVMWETLGIMDKQSQK